MMVKVQLLEVQEKKIQKQIPELLAMEIWMIPCLTTNSTQLWTKHHKVKNTMKVFCTRHTNRKHQTKQEKELIITKSSFHSVSQLAFMSYINLAQRKVEYENFRFKHPSLLAVVIEGINNKVIDNQKMIGRFFFRFHVSEDLTIGELSEIMKFKVNAKIPS